MVLGNVPRLFGLIGGGLLIAAGFVPIGCANDQFSGCEASRTCPPGKGGEASGGEGGVPSSTGGSSGSGDNRGGTSGAENGGEGGAATGGGAGASGEGGTGASAGEGGSGGEAGDEPPPDTTAPTIVSVSPADGDTGVRGDTNIVVAFSEPMDRVTAQAAYQSADIPAGDVTFTWNADSTVLTINPNADLAYAEGDSPGLAARAFAASITDTAEDRAGNVLAEDFVFSFSTLRRIAQPLPMQSVIRRRSDGGGTDSPCGGVTPYTFVGDINDNSGSFLFLSGDTSPLPEGIVVWEAGTLVGEQQEAGHDAIFEHMGPFLAYHMSVYPPEPVTWTTAPLRTLGTFSNVLTPGTRTLDVLPAIVEDYERRAERQSLTQYRLSFAQITDGDGEGDLLSFLCDFAVNVRYLIP